MKVKVDELSGVERRLEVTLPAKDVSEKIEETYRELAKTARIKGFRPGRVPRAILERYYSEHVKNEVSTKLMEESIKTALALKKLNPLSPPIVEPKELISGEDFIYHATVEVRPAIEVTDYKGIEIKRKKVKVGDEDVERALERLRDAHAKLISPDQRRPSKEGDLSLIHI